MAKGSLAFAVGLGCVLTAAPGLAQHVRSTLSLDNVQTPGVYTGGAFEIDLQITSWTPTGADAVVTVTSSTGEQLSDTIGFAGTATSITNEAARRAVLCESALRA